MSQQISSLVSIDSRSIYQRLRRKDAWDLADAWGVSYPDGAPLEAMIKILEANSINPLAKPPEGNGIEFESVTVELENGGTKQELYPVHRDHATARKDIDYQGRLDAVSDKQVAQAAAEVKAKEDAQANEIADLKAKIDILMADKVDNVPAKVDKVIAFKDMKMGDLRKAAKASGIKVMPTFKKVDLIRMLEDGND